MKLSNLKTRVTALVLTIALCLTSIVTAPNKAEAATEYIDIYHSSEPETASAEERKDHIFSITKNTPIYIEITVPNRTVAYYNFTDGTSTDSKTIPESAWQYDDVYNEYYYDIAYKNLSTTVNYTLSLTFATNQQYYLDIIQEKPAQPKLGIKQSSVPIAVGLTYKLSVSNASGKVTWSSSNKKIATVDKNGKVTAKKKGNATITAKDDSGAEATCKISVKENKYSTTKLTVKNASYGKVTVGIYNMTYNSKGDLVIKANFVNRTPYKISKLRNIKITVKNSSGKVIGTYSQKSKNVSIKKEKSKSITFTIKKSKLKLKTTQDLTIAKPPTISGQWS